MWNLTLSDAQRQAIKPYVTAANDATELVRLYSAWADKLGIPATLRQLGNEVNVLVIVWPDNDDNKGPLGSEIISLNQGTEADIRQVGGIENWIGLMHASFWYQAGNVLYSHAFRQLDPETFGLNSSLIKMAASLLEPLRSDRRVVCEFGPQASEWRRFRWLFNNDPKTLVAAAEKFGWVSITTAFCGRVFADILTPEEAHELVTADPRAQQASDSLMPIWRQYSQLKDEGQSGRRAELLLEFAKHINEEAWRLKLRNWPTHLCC